MPLSAFSVRTRQDAAGCAALRASMGFAFRAVRVVAPAVQLPLRPYGLVVLTWDVL